MENITDYCYHTHTKRCGHAIGEDEEYVIKAMEQGIKVLGFSDHVFLKGVHLRGNRGEYEQLDEYVSSIRALKEKYKGKMDIYVGFECEYLKEFEDYYRNLLETKKVDYLILGQHGHILNGKPVFYSQYKNKEEAFIKYCNDLMDGIETGLFKYVCHPDFILWSVGSDVSHFEEYSRKIIEKAIAHDMPLEINLGGRRKKDLDEKHLYANEAFFKLVGEYKNAKVIIGFDAHSPEDFKNSDVAFAKYLIEKYHLNEIKRVRID